MYVNLYDVQTICLYFLIENDTLLVKYNIIQDKPSADIQKEFDIKLSVIENF